MKLKITKPFVDRFTNELYTVGQEVEFSRARAEEILDRVPDYVELVVKAEPKKATKKAKKKEEA